MTTLAAPSFINLFDPAFSYDSPLVAQARETHWYADSPLGPIVLRHEEAWEVLKDRRLVPGGRRYMESHGITSGPLFDWFVGMIASIGQEDHDRLRPLVIRVFSPKYVESFRAYVRETAERLAANIAALAGECEFVSAFAEPLPALVMCRMLGVPQEDYIHFHKWAHEMGLTFNHSTEDLPRAEAAVVAMSAYVTSMLEERRNSLTDDLVSNLLRAHDGGEITWDELHNLVLTLVWAAQDTTARQLGRTIVAFSQHPDQWNDLAINQDLASQAAEEVFRWTPQARVTFRFALEDVEINDLTIKHGTGVFICIAAANRDPRAYDDPDRFDIHVQRKPRQLVFGGGIHMCLGAAAGRLELTEGLAALTRRFGPPEITGPVVWSPNTAMIHGPHELPIRFAEKAA
jgi:cytochrome P450